MLVFDILQLSCMKLCDTSDRVCCSELTSPHCGDILIRPPLVNRLNSVGTLTCRCNVPPKISFLSTKSEQGAAGRIGFIKPHLTAMEGRARTN